MRAKTEMIRLSHNRKIKNKKAASQMYGKPLVLAQDVKYLRVVLHSKLKWSALVETVRAKSVLT